MTYGYCINGEKRSLTEEERKELLKTMLQCFGYEKKEEKKQASA